MSDDYRDPIPDPAREPAPYGEQPPAYEPAPQPPAYQPAPPAPAPAYEPAPAQPAEPDWVPASPVEPPVGPVHAGPVPIPPPPQPTRARAGCGSLLLAAILGGLLGATIVGGALYYLQTYQRAATPATPGVSTPAPSANASDTTGGAVESAAAKVLPSIVNIAVRSVNQTPFGNRTSSGIGSGIIIRADGYVLTNNHVVEGAQSILVRLGTDDVPAKVVGTDPSSDLAVVKVERTGLVAADLGDSSSVVVGEPVVAVGSPFGLDKTVTSGIVSALHRSNLAESGQDIAAYTNLIQTDASINPGNSGGALADLQGRVIGINTLISSTSGSSAGIGFAIPIDYARSIADQIIAGKKVEHPYMGISAVTIDDALRQQYQLPASSGALVQRVLPGSPADKAGIQEGDIIVKIDNQSVRSFEDVLATIRAGKIGQSMPVEIIRDGKNQTVTVTLASDTAAR